MPKFLFKVTIQPKKEGEFTTSSFNIEAKDLAEAASKIDQIPDIDYLYDPDRCDILFARDGFLY